MTARHRTQVWSRRTKPTGCNFQLGPLKSTGDKANMNALVLTRHQHRRKEKHKSSVSCWVLGGSPISSWHYRTVESKKPVGCFFLSFAAGKDGQIALLHPIRHTMEYYSAMKKEILLFGTTQTDLEDFLLHEMSQTEKNKYHMISIICGLWKEQAPRYREQTGSCQRWGGWGQNGWKGSKKTEFYP